jgi:hypothetical protein
MMEEANFKTTNGKIQNSNDVRIDKFAKGKTCNDARIDADFTTINSPVKNYVTDVNCNTAWTDATKETLTDDHLFYLCKKYGENARIWRQKFAGLLPEVFHRKLYEKKGFGSIFEFAAKLAGMSQEQVRVVLNLERKFEDKPVLKNLLIGGKVSANKLVRIASIATAENQQVLACMTEKLSNRAIETFVKDEKWARKDGFMSEGAVGAGVELGEKTGVRMPSCEGAFKNQNGLQEPLFDDKSLHVHFDFKSKGADVNSSSSSSSALSASPLEIIKLKLDKDVLKKLLELQEKNIDVNGLIRKMLQNRTAEIAREKEEIAEEIYGGDVGKEQVSAEIAQRAEEINGGACYNSEVQVSAEIAQGEAETNGCVQAEEKMGGDVGKFKKSVLHYKKPSRYIPARIRKIINEEQGDKCSVPNCKNLAQVTHHELPFAIAKNHMPNNLQKLCKAHHELKHMVDVRFYEARKMAVCGVNKSVER